MILLTQRIETWIIFYHVMVIVILVLSVTKTVVLLVVIFSTIDVYQVAFFISRLVAFLYVEQF